MSVMNLVESDASNDLLNKSNFMLSIVVSEELIKHGKTQLSRGTQRGFTYKVFIWILRDLINSIKNQNYGRPKR